MINFDRNFVNTCYLPQIKREWMGIEPTNQSTELAVTAMSYSHATIHVAPYVLQLMPSLLWSLPLGRRCPKPSRLALWRWCRQLCRISLVQGRVKNMPIETTVRWISHDAMKTLPGYVNPTDAVLVCVNES